MQIQYTKAHPEVPNPYYASEGAAGFDLCFWDPVATSVVLGAGSPYVLRTGISVAIPEGYEGQMRGRSGLWFNRRISIGQTGTIDSDYRGELRVNLVNMASAGQIIKRGDRIAQLVIAPVVRAELVCADELPPTLRGAGGFGSTGR